MSGRGKHGPQSWRTKMRNAMMKGTGCTFRDYEVGDAYRHLIGAKPEDEVFGRLATTPGGGLLEQAAREKVEWLFDQAFADGVAVGKSGDDSILAGSSSAYAQAAMLALKPSGDGGEA